MKRVITAWVLVNTAFCAWYVQSAPSAAAERDDPEQYAHDAAFQVFAYACKWRLISIAVLFVGLGAWHASRRSG